MQAGDPVVAARVRWVDCAWRVEPVSCPGLGRYRAGPVPEAAPPFRLRTRKRSLWHLPFAEAPDGASAGRWWRAKVTERIEAEALAPVALAACEGTHVVQAVHYGSGRLSGPAGSLASIPPPGASAPKKGADEERADPADERADEPADESADAPVQTSAGTGKKAQAAAPKGALLQLEFAALGKKARRFVSLAVGGVVGASEGGTGAPARPRWAVLEPTEVRAADYALCVLLGRCPPAGRGPGCTLDRVDRAEHPANCVGFAGATAYCEARGGRLPSQEAWLSVAQRGASGRYVWGDGWPPLGGNYADQSAGPRHRHWSLIPGYRDGHPDTAPVGFYEDRPGYFDLGGNVAEWTRTAAPGAPGYRVVLGASFAHAEPEDLAVQRTRAYTESTESAYLGFRCERGDAVPPARP